MHAGEPAELVVALHEKRMVRAFELDLRQPRFRHEPAGILGEDRELRAVDPARHRREREELDATLGEGGEDAVGRTQLVAGVDVEVRAAAGGESHCAHQCRSREGACHPLFAAEHVRGSRKGLRVVTRRGGPARVGQRAMGRAHLLAAAPAISWSSTTSCALRCFWISIASWRTASASL